MRYVEKKKLSFLSTPLDDRNLLDVHLGLYDDVVVFDHVEKKAFVIHWVRLDQYSSVDKAYNDGIKRVETLVSRVHDIDPPHDIYFSVDGKSILVDLGRNDVGKVSKPGSVKVEKLMNIEQYSHVMHFRSTVTGELLDDLTRWDALHAALPIGTVSGTPKVKAMELIGQPEVTRRGPCSGCKQASRMVCSHPSRDGSCG